MVSWDILRGSHFDLRHRDVYNFLAGKLKAGGIKLLWEAHHATISLVHAEEHQAPACHKRFAPTNILVGSLACAAKTLTR